jgi:hypothetical protein
MARVSTSSEKRAIQEKVRDLFYFTFCVRMWTRERSHELLLLTYSHNVPLNQILFKCFFASPVGSTTKEINSLTTRNGGKFSQELNV